MLYHFSFDPIYNGSFSPRIPKCRIEGENRSIPRISFAKTAKGCLSSMPGGIPALRTLLQWDKEQYLPAIGYLYSLNEKEILKKNEWIDSDRLVYENWVPDAEISSEVWVLKPITCSCRIVRIEDFYCRILKDPLLHREKIVVLERINLKTSHDYINRSISYSWPKSQIDKLLKWKETVHGLKNFQLTEGEKAYHYQAITANAKEIDTLWSLSYQSFFEEISEAFQRETGRSCPNNRTILANLFTA